MPEKTSKSAASYTPKGTDREHCAICRHYIEDYGCTRVTGRVAPRGWCRFFMRRLSAA